MIPPSNNPFIKTMQIIKTKKLPHNWATSQIIHYAFSVLRL